LLREKFRAGAADAAAGSRDECNFACKACHLKPSCGV
jgi:hypothetical protein